MKSSVHSITSPKKYDILIAEAQPIFRLGVKSILSNKDYISQIHEAVNAEKCINMANLYHPNVAIIDINSCYNCIDRIIDSHPNTKIILLDKKDPLFNHDFTDNKQYSVISKSLDPELFIQSIEKLINISKPKVMRYKPIKKKKNPYNLGKRELEIINLLCKSMSSKEIAEELFISKLTVDNHRKNILHKTGCNNTAGVVQWAVKNGLPDS